jgi:hypothetical protein
MLRSSNHFRVVALSAAIIFVVAQLYALHMTTAHAFLDMPPMCEMCDLAKNSGNGLTVSYNFEFPFMAHVFENIDVPSQIILHITSLYLSRAPPLH